MRRKPCSFALRSDWNARNSYALRLDLKAAILIWDRKIWPNVCRHFKKLFKLGLRPKFHLRTKADLFIESPCGPCPANGLLKI